MYAGVLTRNSGAPGQNIEWGPHKSWTMSLIPVGGTERGIVVSTHSTVSPGKVLKIDSYFDFGCLFCPLEFEHTFLCEIITYCNVVFGNYKICLELGGPQYSGALDFVHPCPMVVTPLTMRHLLLLTCPTCSLPSRMSMLCGLLPKIVRRCTPR